MEKGGIHEVISNIECTLYDMYYGEPCYVLKRKSTGERCYNCWSKDRQQRIKTHCDICGGTGFVDGYYRPIKVQIAFDSDPKKTDSQKEWENVFDTKRARLCGYPLLRPGDLVINRDDYKRYVVTHVDTTKLPLLSKDANTPSQKNHILSQLLILEELNPDDNEYNVELKISSSSVSSESESSESSANSESSASSGNDDFYSNAIYIGRFSDGFHETMKYAEDVLYTYYSGEPSYIIKRKSFGTRCPVCWSPNRQQRIISHCDNCHGTGFITGYYQPIIVQIAYDSDPRKSNSQRDWNDVYDIKKVRLSNYPLIKPKDLVINKDLYKRYIVKHVETTKLPRVSQSIAKLSRQNYIISQILTLQELNPDDEEYNLDLSNIPPIPPV